MSVIDEPDLLPRLYGNGPQSASFNRLRKRLVRQTAEAIETYGMAKPASDSGRPRWMVCLSGGKDSYTLLTILLELRARGVLDVDLLAANLDQAQPGFPTHVLPDYLDGLGVPYRIDRRDTYSVVVGKTAPGATMCTLCSRLRRGNLYRMAREEQCEAIVLGHHREDALETFFMNLFHGGRLEAMAPKLRNDEGDMLTLRPLIGCAEEDIAAFARAMAYPIIPCTLCGNQTGLERVRTKKMLASWAREHPGRLETMSRALATVRPGTLHDPSLFDFAALESGGRRPEME